MNSTTPQNGAKPVAFLSTLSVVRQQLEKDSYPQFVQDVLFLEAVCNIIHTKVLPGAKNKLDNDALCQRMVVMHKNLLEYTKTVYQKGLRLKVCTKDQNEREDIAKMCNSLKCRIESLQ